MSQNHSSSTQTSNEIQDDSKQARIQAASYLSEETDSSLFSTILQGVAVLGLFHVSKRAEVINAFRSLKDKDFKHRLLNVRHPKDLEEIKNSHAKVLEEIKRQSKNHKLEWKEGESVEVGIGKFRRKITYDEYARITQSVQIADAAQKEIGQTENNIRLENTVSAYELDATYSQELKDGFSEWKKKNPKGNYHDYLDREGVRLYEKQFSTQEGKKPKDGKNKKMELAKKNETARTEACKEKTQMVIRQHEVVEKILDPKNPISSDEELRRNFEHIKNGISTTQLSEGFQEGFYPEENLQSAPQASVTPAQARKTPEVDTDKLTGGFSEGAYFDEIMGFDPSVQAPPVKETPIPQNTTPQNHPSSSLPPTPPLKTPPPRPITNLFEKISARFKSPVFSKLGSFLSKTQSLFAPVLNPLSFGIGKLMKGGLGKLGKSLLLKAGLGALTGGIGTAVSMASDGIKALTKALGFEVDLVGLSIKGVLALGCIIVFVVLFPFVFLLLVKPTKGITPALPGQNIQGLSLKDNSIWTSFAKNYLETSSTLSNNNKDDWLSFENKFLSKNKYLGSVSK